MDDLPSGQIAHPTGNLNSHVDQVLLRNRLWEQKMTTFAVTTEVVIAAAYYLIPLHPKILLIPTHLKNKATLTTNASLVVTFTIVFTIL